jgi:glycosyltransferase involved in cell wall biosynthesis
MRHVAYLIPTIDRIGGAEQQMLLLARGMLKRGWRVSIIAVSGNGRDLAPILQSKGAAYLTLNMKGLLDPGGRLRLRRWISSERPDVLHAHLPQASLLARWSRLVAPMPVLIDTIHSPEVGSTTRQLAYRATTWLPDLVTAVSRAAATPWIANKLVDADRLAIIPNGIDLNRWRRADEIQPAIRSQFKLNDRFVWLSVGRLDPVKDHATLLHALSLLPDSASLVIAGAGPLKTELLSLSRSLGIDHRVTLLGFEPDVRRWLQAADAFVLCSRSEGLPIALLEASACELPAVTTDLPGIRELLPDQDACFTAPVGDAGALAAAMNRMMCLTEPARQSLGQSARKQVAERFSLDSILDQWEAAYSGLLQQNPHPHRFCRSAVSGGRTRQAQ